MQCHKYTYIYLDGQRSLIYTLWVKKKRNKKKGKEKKHLCDMLWVCTCCFTAGVEEQVQVRPTHLLCHRATRMCAHTHTYT
jgi:hypothetical protein